MGQDESRLVDESEPSETLQERSLSAVASYIQSGLARNVVVLTGAGISTAAGIPDFRSPKTGLYANLARLNIPEPEAVFDISYFRRNPTPFYVLANELYPGKYKPTISHAFIALLANKGLLRMLLTQNIDCLERAAGVPGDAIIEAHGSFASQRCIECKRSFPDDKMREHVEQAKVPKCEDEDCGGLVKPDIVFFGESLPREFGESPKVMAGADLVLVIGTSLSVYPFAGLPENTRPGIPRVLFNMERVGSMGSRADDVLVLGQCDDGIRQLADKLGWRSELETFWRNVVGDEEAEKQLGRKPGQDAEEEVQKLADHVEAKLNFEEHSKLSEENKSEVEAGTGVDRDTTDNLAGKDSQAPSKPHVVLSDRVKQGQKNLEGQPGVPGQQLVNEAGAAKPEAETRSNEPVVSKESGKANEQTAKAGGDEDPKEKNETKSVL